MSLRQADHPEESCEWCVCYHKASIMKWPWPTMGCCAKWGIPCWTRSIIQSISSDKTDFFGGFTQHFYPLSRSQNIVRGTATSHGLGCLRFESRQVKMCFLFSKSRSHRLCGPSSILFSWYQGSFLAAKRPEREVDIHLLPVPRIGITVPISLLSLYACMAWTGTASSLPLCLYPLMPRD
jgi:hypothetical protein